MSTPRTLILALCAAFVISASFSLVLLREGAYQNAVLQIQTQRSLLSGELRLIHGTVETIDAVSRDITVVTMVPSADSGLDRWVIRAHVTPLAYIAREELYGNNGVYDFLSISDQVQLSDIKEGDRVALLTSAGSDGRIQANVILFGLPL